jgi:hypothetical protein
VIMLIAMWFLVPLGIEGIAWAVAIGTFARYLLLAQLSIRLAAVTWKAFFAAQGPGSVLGIAVFSSVYLGSELASLIVTSSIIQLLIVTAIASSVLAMSFLLLPRLWFQEVYVLIYENCNSFLPGWIHRIIGIKLCISVPRIS